MNAKHSAGWLSIVLIHAITVLSMGTVGAVAALVADLAAALSAKPADVGLAIAMFSAPSAVLATLSGGVIDRIGAKQAIWASTLIAAAACPLIAAAPSLLALQGGLLLAGLAFTGITVAAPAFFISSMNEALRVRAMALWSTYPPTGFAAGLLLAAPFAGGEHWRIGLIAIGILLGAAGILAFWLPAAQKTESERRNVKIGEALGVLRNPLVLRLGAATAIPSAISYGVSLIAPSYLAKVHAVDMTSSSLAVAAAKGLAMLLCGLVMGYILARLKRVDRLFVGLAAFGFAAQILLFFPAVSFIAAASALFFWLLAYGGLTTTAMAQMPAVATDPAHRGLVSGVIGQCISIASFLAPSIYFGMPHWTGFLIVGGLGLLIAAIALPVRREDLSEASLPGGVQTAE